MALSYSIISWTYGSLSYRIKSMEKKKREIMALWGG